MKLKEIIWDRQAVNYFRNAIGFIREDSPQNADKVKKAILDRIAKLSKRPESHAPDKYKINNTGGDYKVFEIYKFRISYLVKEETIIIARIRHANQKPLDY